VKHITAAIQHASNALCGWPMQAHHAAWQISSGL